MKSREVIAKRIAMEFKDGDLVNLGAGIPGLVVDYLPKDIKVYLHAENGIVGFGPDDPSLPRDLFRTEAAEKRVSIIPGGSIVDSATGFGLVRGGHLTATVLGTMQVDEEGSIANWMVPGGKFAGMGGAMDLVVGAKRVIVATEHCAKDGSPKILKKCNFPLTGYKRVSTIVTELAYIDVTKEGLVLKEVAPGVTVEEVIKKTEAKLIISPELCEMKI